MTEVPAQLQSIEARIRRRFRAQIVKNHKQEQFLVRKLIKMGVDSRTACGSVYKENRGTWRLSHSVGVERAWSNQWFREQGLYSAVAQKLTHWKPLSFWVKLT